MQMRFATATIAIAAAILMPLSVCAKTKAKANPVSPAKSAAVTEPAAEEASPPSVEVPESIVTALAKGDLNGALIQMRDEKPTPKLKQVMNDVSRAATFDMRGKIDRSEAHKAYQNVAVSYHNLYLFLKRRDIDQKKYFEMARKYYSKARSAATLLHKSECDLLMAALLASAGEGEKARKIFDKIDIASMRGDFESVEYMAAYYAASGQTEDALEALGQAYKISPDRTLAWLAAGDDFAQIENDPRYQGQLDSWRSNKKDRNEVTLSIPRKGEPRLEMSSPEIQFAPQKMMKHASSKESAVVSKKRAVQKSAASSREGKKAAAKKSTVKSGKSTAKVAVASKKTTPQQKSTARKSQKKR